MEDRAPRAGAAPPSNFLSFAIGTARIADRNFEYACATLGQFDGELRINVKCGTFERNTLEQIRANHLVTGFHVGEVEIGNQVAQEGEQFIAERVAEEKSALVPAGHEARSENGISIFIQKQLNHLQEVPG